jgi:histidyl-tRNA synthetase
LSEAAKPENERRKFKAIKGTRDILPPDTALWNWFEKTARSVMESYNFGEIRTPIFEETELFARSIGAETDVVNKEMYTFAVGEIQRQNSLEELVEAVESALRDGAIERTSENEQRLHRIHDLYGNVRSGAGAATAITNKFGSGVIWSQINEINKLVGELSLKLTLRPEATASVCRAYIEHGMQTLPGNQKLYYIGPMFRRERPQKGRYRQFYQIGAEVLGTSDAPAIDAELIEMLTDLLDRCQIDKYTLLINSIGCQTCRPKYVELLRAELRKPEIFSKLGADSQRRVETNPLRVMDSKLPEEQPIIEKLPKISEHLCPDCRAHYEKLKHELKLREVDFVESPRLVRGLDYYMRTTFEITSPILGAQNALCGGGRYDGLVEMLGGPKGIKGIGFALGEDRFIEAIQEARLGEQAKQIHAPRPLDIFIAWMGDKAYPTAVRLAHVLRDERHTVELPPEEMKFRKALERADKLGARFVLILGEDEVKSDTVTIKQLSDGKQEKISEEALVDYFRPK